MNAEQDHTQITAQQEVNETRCRPTLDDILNESDGEDIDQMQAYLKEWEERFKKEEEEFKARMEKLIAEFAPILCS